MTKRKKILRVGLDFDGVIAYNPIRVARYPIAYIKRTVLHKTRTSFYIPQTPIAKFLWGTLFATSTIPAVGCGLLREMAEDKQIEAHLISSRFTFMHEYMFRWLDRHNMRKLFTTVVVNTKDEQPHVFKRNVLERMKLDYYIEDNLDIVKYLTNNSVTKVLWIYNILDRLYPYKDKYPFLKKALQSLQK